MLLRVGVGQPGRQAEELCEHVVKVSPGKGPARATSKPEVLGIKSFIESNEPLGSESWKHFEII